MVCANTSAVQTMLMVWHKTELAAASNASTQQNLTNLHLMALLSRSSLKEKQNKAQKEKNKVQQKEYEKFYAFTAEKQRFVSTTTELEILERCIYKNINYYSNTQGEQTNKKLFQVFGLEYSCNLKRDKTRICSLQMFPNHRLLQLYMKYFSSAAPCAVSPY